MEKYYLAVLKNEQHPTYKRGWGNGYVLVPKSSILYGRRYLERVAKKVEDALVKVGSVFVLPEYEKYSLPYFFEDIDVHGGITFNASVTGLYNDNFEWIGDMPTQPLGDYWMFGFDTAHSGDCLGNRPKEWVIQETKSLSNQLMGLERKYQ